MLPVAEKSIPTCYYHPQWLPLPHGMELSADKAFETAAAQYADIGFRAWNSGALLTADKIIVEKSPIVKGFLTSLQIFFECFMLNNLLVFDITHSRYV